ncbi:uncharacterized protein KY384_003468 [Bacidia gigantensis]|uniref:uncharacterized protein n=1 Tax=Bacidia gigantensis TaxID=2732470 RepID=UPI001D059EBE|nr:uncharacterized protein KY384_003468 [Bacidia gigantensis]KAG8531832.1 hypothetical protein KY384_003468 [Bacidia gigantensis]
MVQTAIDATTSNVVFLPLEIQLKILTFAMQDEVEVDFENFLAIETFHPFVVEHRVIVEHRNDWKTATSVSRAWREVGMQAFFEEKVFLLRPHLMDDLVYHTLGSVFIADRAAFLKHIRHVIVPIKNRHNFWKYLTYYFTFAGLRSLHFILDEDAGYLDQVSSLVGEAFDVLLPKMFVDALKAVGFDFDHLNLKLLVSKKFIQCGAQSVAEVVNYQYEILLDMIRHIPFIVGIDDDTLITMMAADKEDFVRHFHTAPDFKIG